MAKKKRTDTKTKSDPTKQTPAMYPTPAPVELETPQKIVAADLKTDPKTKTNTITFTIEGSQPPEHLAAINTMVEFNRRQMDMIGRLLAYKTSCLNRLEPHWGKRPKHIPPAQWQDLNVRFRLIPTLQFPDELPAPVRDALFALQKLLKLDAELQKASPISATMQRAICYAIDLGQLLQRGQVELDFGATVESSRRSANGRAKGNPKKTEDTRHRDDLVRQEFIEIRDEGILTRQSDIIRRMLDRAKLSDGSDMPSESKIQKATVGLTPRKTSRNRTPKR